MRVKNPHHTLEKRLLNRIFQTLAVLAVLFSFRPNCLGQDFSRLEVFGGYSFFRVSAGNTDVKISGNVITASRGPGRFRGWDVSLGYNPLRRLGIVGEYSEVEGRMEYKIRILDVSARLDADSIFKSLLAGLRYSARGKRFTLSGRALGGAAAISQSANLTGQVTTVRGLSYAVALGGEMDLRLTRRFSWRVVKGDYLLTRFRERLGGEARQHSARISTGLVLHLFNR